ncbi:MAG: ABC transporter ATP-binding protein [Desulfobacterales bacterium]
MIQKTIIQISDVSFSYPGKQDLFADISIALKKGGFYLISGPSGEGKSSLLRLINRLEDPTRGEILFNGRPLSSYSPPILRRHILYIQQAPSVIDGRIRENLLLPFTFKSNKSLAKPNDTMLLTLLKDFRLDGIHLDDHAQSLSVGQLQRICFIRGLLLSPEIILLDEPTSALDDESSRIVESKAEELCSTFEKTVLMISHRKFKPEKIVPELLHVADGHVREIKWNPES